jgi:hypothetical protein
MGSEKEQVNQKTLEEKFEAAAEALLRASSAVEELYQHSYGSDFPITERDSIQIEGIAQGISEYLWRMRVLRLRLNKGSER